MALCPHCQHDIGDDFGLVTCPNCGQSSFLDLEGQAEKTFSEMLAVATKNRLTEEAEDAEDAALVEESEEISFGTSGDTPVIDEQIEAGFLGQSPALEQAEEPPPLAGEFPPAAHEPMSMEEAMQDVREFGNTDTGSVRDGNLLYTIRIRGIDSKDLRQELLACLQDPKFGWNINEIDELITDGFLALANISPAKAHVVINRIKYLPFDVDWIQHEVTIS